MEGEDKGMTLFCGGMPQDCQVSLAWVGGDRSLQAHLLPSWVVIEVSQSHAHLLQELRLLSAVAPREEQCCVPFAELNSNDAEFADFGHHFYDFH